jgi:small GTP-binding protein
MSYDYCFKIILIGDQNSGKTSIVQRLSTDKFYDFVDSTIGVEFVSLQRSIAGKTIKYHLWDTAGQETFMPLIKNYYKGVASGFLIVDSTDKEWRENTEKWLERYEKHKFDKSLPIILILNKIDLPMEVTFEEFQKEAKLYDLKSYQVSAKTGLNMNKLIENMTEHITEAINKGEDIPGVTQGVNLRQMEGTYNLQQEEAYNDCFGCIIN